MPFLHTVALFELLKVRLESLPLAAEDPQGAKLFERVGYFGAEQLGEALKATFASENRVCFLVPVGDEHASVRDRNFLYSSRETRLVLLIGDRAMDRAKQPALVGGPANLGILELKDRIIDDLLTNAFAEVADLAFVPTAGQPLVIEQTAGQNLGRACWMQEITAFAGSARRAIP